MKQERRYQPIQATLTTWQELSYIAKARNMSKTKLLAEIVSALFEICGTYDRILAINQESSVLEHSVTFTIQGRNRTSLGLGSVPASKRKEILDAFGYNPDLTEKKKVEK